MPDLLDRLKTALADRYAIERELGAGGMATVYLAEDLKHHRKVAVKVLRPELAAVLGAERFVQEITTTANLQHPHILPLHDSGDADGFLYYVMPFIDGETLRDKLNRETQLGIDEAVSITTAIADALDYAHRNNVIHRDIKPENILLHDGRPMVADFGIALALSAAAGGRMTETGMSLGTPHYMSPEQATAEKDLTNRSDIYSLGCVLYEMLTGDPPHTGSSAQAILMKIVTEDVQPVTELRKSVPPNVAVATGKALEKLVADRFATAKEFAEALTNPAFTLPTAQAAVAGAPASGPWKRLSVVMTALAAIFALAFVWALSRPPQSGPVVRFTLVPPEGQEPSKAGVNVALSPDGSRVVYGGRSQLFERRLDGLSIEAIPGTERGWNPVLSPDGASVAFVVARSIRTVSLLGGPPRTVVASGVPTRSGIDWGSDGMLYFTDDAGAIQRVPVTGGEPEPVTANDAGTAHRWVDVLPEGRGLLFTITRGTPDRSEIAVMGFDEGEVRTLLLGAMARYATSGHLVFAAADGTLLATPFDLRRLEVTGPPMTLSETVATTRINSSSQFAVSATGTLLYVPGGRLGTDVVPVWVERDGTGREIDPGWSVRGVPNFSSLALSPDEGRLALSTLDSEGRSDLWVKQLDRGPLLRLTTEGQFNIGGAWSADGRWLAFESNRAGAFDLWRKRADGSGTAELVLDVEELIGEGHYSPDGTWLVFRKGSRRTGDADIYALRPGMDSVPVPLVATQFSEHSPTISPDGRWVAYVSDRSGREEVYVSPFPDAASGGLVLVSTDGGAEPVWAHSGRELFYRNGSNELVAVQVSGDPSFSAGQQVVLFSMDGYLLGNGRQQYDVSSDDQRFVMLRIDDDDSGTPKLIVVENFFEELKAKVGN